MLKAKHVADFIPFMKDKTGNEVSSDKENQRLIANHFRDLLTDNLVLKEDQDRASNKVKMCRPKTIPPIQSLWLEQELSAEEISRAIDILPIRKSPGKDGLSSEFFKTFKECLIGPLVAVWREAISFEALPLPINEGIIKLIHKKEEKNIITNWRPITMLNCAYKIFAKALALRLKDHMSKWIRQEQKGFIKGRFILDNIVTLWEAMEYAEEVGQDYVFLKIDFDKAYDKLNWNYTIDALRHMGCGEKFCSMVKTLLGNASAKVNVNGILSESFRLSRSIRRGWKMQGIVIDNGDQICIEMFADDTNAIMQNDADCIANFWECLHIYCTASGSVINHTKTGFRTSIQSPPIWLTEEGCKPIKDGEIVRILGIPMGFKVSLKKRWQWIMNKIEGKLKFWRARMLNMAGRRMIINHCIIPMVIYFLSCWRRPEDDLNFFTALCRNFLWGGDPWTKKMAKVKDLAGLHRQDSIWWPALAIPQVEVPDMEEAIKMHKMGIKLWENIWDDESNSWFSRANLIAEFNLSNRQLDVIGRRIMRWDPGEWWLMSLKTSPKIAALQWKKQTVLWPIPPHHSIRSIHKDLNKRWSLLRDRKQWKYLFFELWGKYVEPKKACLTWLVMYRAIWTQKKAKHLLGKGDGKCGRCGLEEDDIHIFLQCKAIAPWIASINRYVVSNGREVELHCTLALGIALLYSSNNERVLICLRFSLCVRESKSQGITSIV
ncbi:hypothetical protein L7F22_026030 [Adiantum nelumboides]|nr:hypothetical protein [Adiantum nelumboides]